MAKQRKTREDAGESPLKQLREEFGMSQEEFARQIRTSARTVSRWEAGDNLPTFTIVQMKALDQLMRTKGKTLEDLPDWFGPTPEAGEEQA